MRTTIKTSSTTLTPNKRVTTNNTTSLSVALRASQQFYSAARVKSRYSGLFNSLAKKLNQELEQVIVKELGGGKIREGTGGFFPDYFITLESGITELREQKLVATVEQDGQIIRRSGIKVGGGTGLLIKGGKMNLVTGFTATEQGVTAEKAELPTTRLLNDLIKNKNNQQGIVNVLSGKSQAATAIRTTLTAKANSIDIPVNFQGKLQNRTIRFTWQDMKKAAISKKGKFVIKKNADGSINLNFEFFGSTITKALNNMDKVIVKELNGKLGRAIAQAIAEQATAPGPGFTRELKKFLRDLGFDYALRYIPGSAKIISGTVVAKKAEQTQRPRRQQFISGVQWTALTQQRLGQTMQRLGPPDPPDLKERSGRFRGSIQVNVDYRKRLLQYTYNPLYQSLEQYGYRPDIQVQTAIREVAQSLYSQQFRITRA